eukprot:6492691-Amphidinium_carterae.3
MTSQCELMLLQSCRLMNGTPAPAHSKYCQVHLHPPPATTRMRAVVIPMPPQFLSTPWYATGETLPQMAVAEDRFLLPLCLLSSRPVQTPRKHQDLQGQA